MNLFVELLILIACLQVAQCSTLSDQYKLIDQWISANVPSRANHDETLRRAAKHFSVSEHSMRPEDVAAWNQFLELKSIADKCDLEALKVLRKNFDAAGLRWPETDKLSSRLQQTIYSIQESHSTGCAKTYRSLVGTITFKFNVEKKFLGKLIKRLDIVSEGGAYYYSEPNSVNEIAFYEGIEKMPASTISDAIFKGYKFANKRYVASLSKATSGNMIKDLFDTCNAFIITTRDWMDVLIFDKISVNSKVFMGQSDMDWVRFSWLRYHVCKSIVQRDQAELTEAIGEHFNNWYDETDK